MPNSSPSVVQASLPATFPVHAGTPALLTGKNAASWFMKCYPDALPFTSRLKPAIISAGRKGDLGLTNDGALDLFVKAGALLTGHFKLSSGLHSDRYLEKFRLVENPALAEPMCEEIARRFADSSIELVLGPTTAGIILAYNVARHLGVEARFAEKEEGVRRLRRGQILAPGARVLVVDDILSTGGAVRECIQLLAAHDAILAGVGVLADRSGGAVDLGTRLEALLTMTVEAFAPEACPLCKEGVPIYQPGTTGVKTG